MKCVNRLGVLGHQDTGRVHRDEPNWPFTSRLIPQEAYRQNVRPAPKPADDAENAINSKEIAQYWDDGYHIVRGVLTADEIVEYRRLVRFHVKINAYEIKKKYPVSAPCNQSSWRSSMSKRFHGCPISRISNRRAESAGSTDIAV